MPKIRPFQARADRRQFVALTVTLDRATYDAMVADAERFIAMHLRRCAEAGGRRPREWLGVVHAVRL
ncbi:MAG TPA: hypothetical protein VGR97_07585, partial [Candidatus Acidoferrales bacterium]|nr:hypothetical protein [Candidatus Acidoferrales bacterium]